MWDGFNKRKFPRLNLQCEITLHEDPHSPPIETTTENLGAGGLCVILRKPLERFSKCHLRIKLEEPSSKIECAGRVVWAVSTGDMKGSKPRFDTGIEFENIDAESSEKIRNFIQTQAAKPA